MRQPRCRPISIGNSASSSSSLATGPMALKCSERSEGRGFNPLTGTTLEAELLVAYLATIAVADKTEAWSPEST